MRHEDGTAALVRAAGPRDLPGMVALLRHLSPEDPEPDPAAAAAAWDRLLASGLATVLVAELPPDGLLAASCTLVVVPNLTRNARPYALVENVVTHAAHRRQGLGQAVLRAALDRAFAAGCYKVMLATGSRQDSVLRFYERAGFTRGGKTCFEMRRP